jgi:hypothetical protein
LKLKWRCWLDSFDGAADRGTARLFARAASDFATLSASNRDRILHAAVAFVAITGARCRA